MALRTSKTPVATVSTSEPVTVAVTEEPIREREYDLYEQRGSGPAPTATTQRDPRHRRQVDNSLT